MIRKLSTFGFDPPKSGRGPHPLMRRGKFKLTVPNPHGSDVDGTLVDRILKQAGISVDDWNEA